MASSVASPTSLIDNAHEWLETAPTLIDLVRHVDVDRILRDADDRRFEALEYDAAPTVRALFCRELTGLSWNELYEHLSTDARAIRVGFDSTKFGPYNTAPTRQTLTAAWMWNSQMGQNDRFLP